MKALILAAGLGTRLAPITNDVPKSLVPVNGKPILFKQIDNLLKNGVTEITIVSGYKADVLKQRVGENYKNIKIIESVDYASTNNMYSAYLGIKQIGTNDGFLMMNADVFFDCSVIAGLLAFPGQNAIVTDIGNYLEESMKVVKQKDRLIEISKQVSKEEAYGVSIDVYKFGQDGAEAFFNQCKDYIENKKELKKWSEVALNDILKEVKFEACPLIGRWFEIDNHDDLAIAEKIFK